MRFADLQERASKLDHMIQLLYTFRELCSLAFNLNDDLSCLDNESTFPGLFLVTKVGIFFLITIECHAVNVRENTGLPFATVQ